MRTIKRLIAGAFIFSNDGYILLGRSNTALYEGSWLVPGGGIEPGETARDAAIRETLEEVGVDISAADIQEIGGRITGQSEKVLRETGERVLVDMEFHDFVARVDMPAKDIHAIGGDDMSDPAWQPIADLPSLLISPGMHTRLQELGYI